DIERREREGRQRRLEGVKKDHDDWAKRQVAARKRTEALAEERVKADRALNAAREAPHALIGRKAKLLDDFTVAEARRSRAADALAEAEGVLADADRASRQADHAASEAREQKAALQARLDASRERLTEIAA